MCGSCGFADGLASFPTEHLVAVLESLFLVFVQIAIDLHQGVHHWPFKSNHCFIIVRLISLQEGSWHVHASGMRLGHITWSRLVFQQLEQLDLLSQCTIIVSCQQRSLGL